MNIRSRAQVCRLIVFAVAITVTAPPLTLADMLGTVTVEAQRKQDALRKQVGEFFKLNIVRSPFEESMMRWDHAICPLIAGMNQSFGEFVLARLSERAREAGVPLAKENCKPANLFIIVAQRPDIFLKLWWRRSPLMYNTEHGMEPLKRFIEKSRPIRVWYNEGPPGDDNVTINGGILATSANPGLGNVDYPVVDVTLSPGGGSRLSFPVVRDISSAIVVIEPDQVSKLNIGQLADYLALISFAEINLDADPGDLPTIRNVFASSDTAAPMEMTSWDKVLLRSLYATPQENRMQFSKMETYATKMLLEKLTP